MSLKQALAAVILAGASVTASAIPINADFEFFALAQEVDHNNDGSNDSFDFWGGQSPDGTLDNDISVAMVTFADSDFTDTYGVTAGQQLRIRDLNGTNPFVDNSPYWSLDIDFGGLQGTIDFFVYDTRIVDGGSPLDISAKGTLKWTADTGCSSALCNQLDDTDAVWRTSGAGGYSWV